MQTDLSLGDLIGSQLKQCYAGNRQNNRHKKAVAKGFTKQKEGQTN